MSITQKDKIDLLGIVKKNKIKDINDIILPSRKKLTYLEYLDISLSIFKKILNDNSSIKTLHNSLMAIRVIIGEMYSYEINVDSSSYESLSSLKDVYHEYLEKNNLTADEEIDELIDRIINITISTQIDFGGRCISNPELKDENTEETKEDKVEEVVEEETTTQIKELEKELLSLRKSNAKLTTSISKRDKEIDELRRTLKETKAELKRESSSKSKNEKKLLELEQKLTSAEEVAESSKNKYDLLRDDYKRLKEEEKNIRQIKIQQEENEREALLEYEVLKLLTTGMKTIEGIVDALKSSGIKCNYKDVYNAIINLKKRYTIDCPTFKKGIPVYNLAETRVPTNLSKSLIGKVKNILIISDLHLGIFNSYDEKRIDLVYEYAIKNGIEFIINLGDVFSYDHQSGTDKLNRMQYNEEVLNAFIEGYPYDRNIKNLILGGNHDKNITTYSIDPIAYLETNRTDIFSLGYDHAILGILDDKFALHHPCRKFEVDEHGREYASQDFIDYLNDYYERRHLNRDEIYLDLFGHFHKSVLTQEGVVFVPSLLRDRVQDGAWHLQIEFDNDKIKNITFIPLIQTGRSLIKTGELVYKKR